MYQFEQKEINTNAPILFLIFLKFSVDLTVFDTWGKIEKKQNLM